MRAELTRRREATSAQRQALSQRLADWSAGLLERLLASRETLRLAEPLVQLDPAIRGRGAPGPSRRLGPGGRGEATGAAAARDPEPALRPHQPRPPAGGKRPGADGADPNRLLAPFALLVNQYGIPRYGEVDPTPLFAVTFLLMFGTMFGDVGQGAVIAGLAWYFRAKLGRFWLFGLMAGASSMVFGFLYGSVFGFEHVLPALWMWPLHDPF